LGREGIEKILWEVLGARRVIWLGRGIAGDDTHGHVDDVARFIAPEVVLLCEEKNQRDENYAALEENRERLESVGMEVVRLPMPSPLAFAGQRLLASYANFYIANAVVIVPTFNDVNDRRALATIAEFFPERQVVGIHCVDLVWGLGTLHCATQQEPV
jgi:agmatine deiminase